MLVYKLTNEVTGKIYIGQTKHSLKHRLRKHKNEANEGYPKAISAAIREYGMDSFTSEVLYVGTSKKDILEKEAFFVAYYRSNDPAIGYNQTSGGQGSYGYKHREEAKTLMREKARAINKEGENNPNYGNKWTLEMRENLSRKKKGKPKVFKSEETRNTWLVNMSLSKMGAKNPAAAVWTLITPEGVEYTFHGGIKRELKALGLSYQIIWRQHRGVHNGYLLFKDGERKVA